MRHADRAANRRFRKVLAIEAIDEALLSSGNRLLRLNYFKIVRHTGRESVACLYQLFRREFPRALRHFHLFTRGIQIEKSGAHFIVDAPTQVGGFGRSLRERDIRLLDRSANPAALENGKLQPTAALYVPWLSRTDGPIVP